MFRCACNNCEIMGLAEECTCCKEIQEVSQKMAEVEVSCITKHPGFHSVCLNEWVLQMSYFGYVQEHGREIYRNQASLPE